MTEKQRKAIVDKLVLASADDRREIVRSLCLALAPDYAAEIAIEARKVVVGLGFPKR